MKKVLFVCVGNSCRSQIAEGFAKHLSRKGFEIRSAGTKPALAVSGKAEQVMAEDEIDITSQYPKGFSSDDLKWADKVIIMGCGVQHPELDTARDKLEDWNIDDPIGQPIETYREIRDEIKQKVMDLLESCKTE